MKNIFSIINTLLFLLFALVSFALPLHATRYSLHASIAQAAQCGKLGDIFQSASPELGQDSISIFPSNLCTASDFLVRILNILFSFAAVVATLAIVIGGFMYFGAAGNPESATKGRQVIQNAIIGLAVVILSFTIVNLAARFLVDSNSVGGGGTTTNPDTKPTPTNPDPNNPTPTNPNNPSTLKLTPAAYRSVTPANTFDASQIYEGSSVDIQVRDAAESYAIDFKAVVVSCEQTTTSQGNCVQRDADLIMCQAQSMTVYDTLHPGGVKKAGFELTEANRKDDKGNVIKRACRLIYTITVPKTSLTPQAVATANKSLLGEDTPADMLGNNYIVYAEAIGVGNIGRYFGEGVFALPLTK